MTLQSLRTACLLTSAIALLIFNSWARAANEAEQSQQSGPSLVSKDRDWILRLPKDDKVVYRGVVSLDGPDRASPSILYPASDAASLLAGIITHGILVGSANKIQKNKLQDKADEVLSPYHAVLDTFNHKELMQRALERTSMGGSKKLIEFSEKPEAGWLIESTPVFSITQDQSAIILDNSIAIYTPDAEPATAYRNNVKVVSQARDGENLDGFWIANQGEKLKEESASLFAQSLDIAVGEATRGASDENNAYKTIRYLEGNTEKMERAQIVSERCNRVVIKTLRGSLMSVPAKRGAAAAPGTDQCGDALSTLK
jgi:hypothetical protein